jgi:D-beta-D-heptose 7-phosphate kinase/D-beta-D-heptose 1-phosphate adenosyltransferase
VSREAPVPTVRQRQLTESLGWAGNVATNIKALGHNVLLMATIGDRATPVDSPGYGDMVDDPDDAGIKVMEIAKYSGVTTCLPVSVDKPTTVKHRITSGGQIIGRLDVQVYGTKADEPLIRGLNSLDQDAEWIKVIVISDNNNGTITAELMQAVRVFANKHGIPIFVDCRPETVHLYEGVALLKPNLPDAIGMLNRSGNVHPGLADTGDAVQQAGVACQQLKEDFKAQSVVVTAGRYGCAYTDGTDIKYYDAFGDSGVDAARDICGAGDTVIAALAVSLMEGMEWSKAVNFSMQCAGYVVRFFGIKLALRDQVEEFIWERSNWTKKLMTEVELLTLLERRRRMDESTRVVLANGCFDGFHAGQLETLRFAKREGELLVVAYNDDTSLRALKGEDRPHVPDSFRASHLASQEPVDAVFRFNGDVETLVRMIRPEVLVKGADAQQQYANLPGANFVASYGGRVAYCPIDQFYVTIDRENQDLPEEENIGNAADSG